MTIESGTLLGPYRVEALIGQGGMGQVYRGLDTRLNRIVAIKVLPSHLSSDPQLRERFDREAKAISSLSDPNICTLFDVGHHEGVDYLVMEFAEGESLADRLNRGPLPPDQVIRYGTEIAKALAAAHRRNIVHRDLKPGNVMITKSGAKLLDFGLAKTASVLSSPNAPTEQHKPLTSEGTILGTFQYMAPEQVEGREADARTDMFAFGTLLYEMATGKRAFDGRSKASIIASILDRDPPSISSIEPATPVALDRLIRACMAKEPDDRLQSAKDAALQLQWLADGETGHRGAPSFGRRFWPVAAAFVALLFLALAAYTWKLKRTAPASAGVNLALLAPPGFTFANATLSSQRVVAFVAGNGRERFLFTRKLDEPQAKQLVQISGTGYPFWSPDGKWIGFFDRNKLMKISVAGGSPEPICDSSYGFGAAWADDGTIIFTPGFGQPLHAVSSSGGTSRPLTRLDSKRSEALHAWPVLLPGKGGILFLADTLPSEMSRIYHVPLGGGTVSEIIAADGIVGYSAPYLLFVRGRRIYSVRIDIDSRRVTGEPKRVAEDADFSEDSSSAFASVTADGTLLYPLHIVGKHRVIWYDREGRSRGVLFEGSEIFDPRISPDGKRLLVTQGLDTAKFGVVSVDLERGVQTLLTTPSAWGGVWLADGERFVFTSARRTSFYDLFVQAEDPQAQPVPLWEGRSDDKAAVALSPDGEQMIVREYLAGQSYDLWLVPLSGNGARKPLLTTPATEYSADISPDGRWLVYSSDASGTQEIYLRPVAGGRSLRVSTAGGGRPRWSRDGGEVFFISPDGTMMSAQVRSGGTVPTVGIAAALFKLDPRASFSWDLSPDGTRFLVSETVDSTGAARPYTVMTGWKEALEE